MNGTINTSTMREGSERDIPATKRFGEDNLPKVRQCPPADRSSLIVVLVLHGASPGLCLVWFFSPMFDYYYMNGGMQRHARGTVGVGRSARSQETMRPAKEEVASGTLEAC